MNRFSFSKAAVDAAIKGDKPPNFMKKYAFKKKDGKLYFEGKVVIPNEERDEYLRTELYRDKSTLPMGRDSLFHILKQKVINISKRDIESFLKAQNVIATRKARPKTEKRKFVNTIKRAGILSGDLVHVRKQDLPKEYMPNRQDDDPDTEYKPGDDDAKVWKGTSTDIYMYNLVDMYTSYLVTEIVFTKKEGPIAKATKTLVARMTRALGVPVREIQFDQGTEFNKSVKDLAKKGIRTRRMITNALVENVNATLQRIFFTLVKQKRAGFFQTLRQSVKIANNTKNRKLQMTPNEAVKILRKGDTVKRREGAHPRPILKKNAYPVGTIVRALVKPRAKVTHHKAYKGKHYGPPQTITKVSFYQGYPKYTLDNVQHTKMENIKVLNEELKEVKKNLADPPTDKQKEDIKSLQDQIKKTRRGAVSQLKWHDQLTVARDVDKQSEELVKERKTVTYDRRLSPYLPGMIVWVYIDDTKYQGRIKTKTSGGGWMVKFMWKDTLSKAQVYEDDIEMALEPGVEIWFKKKLEAKIKKRHGDKWMIKWKEPRENMRVKKGIAEQTEITLRL